MAPQVEGIFMKRTLVISLAGLALTPIAAALAQSTQTTETPQTQTAPQTPATSVE